MKKIIISIIKLLFLCVLIVGCNTDDGTNCPEPLTGELTTIENGFVGTWVLSGMESEEAVDLIDDGFDNPINDIFSQLPDCQKDVEYFFRNDRSYTVRQEYNAVNCNNKLSFDGTWKYANENLTLVTTTLCSSQTLDVTLNGLTEFTITDVLNINDVSGLTVRSNVTLTYTKTL